MTLSGASGAIQFNAKAQGSGAKGNVTFNATQEISSDSVDDSSRDCTGHAAVAEIENPTCGSYIPAAMIRNAKNSTTTTTTTTRLAGR